jgi:hypothetical protein
VVSSIGQLVLVRDEGRCFRCGRVITSGVPSNCHHRLGGGHGTNACPNRITLCGFGNNLHDADGNEWCHGFVHQRSGTARENGWIISKYDKRPPEEIPVRHWRLGMVLLTADYRITGEERADGQAEQAGDQ